MSAAVALLAEPDPLRPMALCSRASGEVMVVSLEGCIDASATGPLCDALVAHVRAGRRGIVVELGAGVTLTRPGLRGLVVAAKLLQARRGQLRLCGASAETESFVRAASVTHLLPCDPDRATALARIAGPVSSRPHATARDMSIREMSAG